MKSIDELSDVVRATMARTTAIRAEKKTKHSPEAWRKVWHDELRKFYPAYVVEYSGAVAANLKRAVQSRGLPAEDVSRLMCWIIKHWPRLRRTVFSFNPKTMRGPEAPDMNLVIKYLPQIYGLFNQDKPENQLMMPKRIDHPQSPSEPPTANIRSGAAPVAGNTKNTPTAFPRAMRGGFRRTPPPVPPIDHAEVERTRIRLGLKKWGYDNGC